MNFLTNCSLYKLKSAFVFHFLKFFFNLFINIHVFISDYLTIFLFYIYIRKIRIKIKKQPLHKHMLNYSDRTRLKSSYHQDNRSSARTCHSGWLPNTNVSCTCTHMGRKKEHCKNLALLSLVLGLREIAEKRRRECSNAS